MIRFLKACDNYMVDEIFPNIFRIKVPLPQNPLGHINSYLIRSKSENLLIDTGLDFPKSFRLLCEGLSEAETKLENLNAILLTHFHVDHVGLIPRFKESSKKINLLIHQSEIMLSKQMMKDYQNYKENIEIFLESNGAPSSITKKLQGFHPAFFTPQAYDELAETAKPLEHGQELTIGNYNFQIIWTPGHSPGHICLYEPSLRILFSGDHILPTITSHISQFLENMDPLTDYLDSLTKIEELDVSVVLPAHQETFSDYHKRIKQLRAHHRRRLTEIAEKLETKKLTAYKIASQIRWDINYKSWEDFPLFQRYLALGETLAHLKILEHKKLVRKTKINDKFFYEKSA